MTTTAQRRALRTRANIVSTEERPRLSVFRSSKHIYAQVIDDRLGNTLATASSKVLGESATGSKTDVAKLVGQAIAEAAKAKGVTKVVFDRGAYKYHGRVKALADAAREGGLEF